MAARVCWFAALLCVLILLGVVTWAVPVIYGRVVWEVAFPLGVALTALLPLTAPWVWFRDAVRLGSVSWPIRANAYLIEMILPYVGPIVVNLMAIPIGFHIKAAEPMGAYYHWNPDNVTPFVLVTALGIALTVGYITWWFILLGRGQTPGKYLLKIRVVSAETGETPSRRRMFVREFLLKLLLMGFHSGIQIFIVMWQLPLLGHFLDLTIPVWLYSLFFSSGYFVVLVVFTTPVVFLVDCLWFVFRKNRQTLHDKMMGTRVVHV